MKLNRKGFTLIELLAVITILGILMIVGIPAVQRTINNSRKDTFVDTAKEYVNAVKTAWASDDISCSGADSGAATAGNHYILFTTDETKFSSLSNGATAKANKEALIQSGGKSSWSNSEVAGYVKVEIGTGNPKYYVHIADQNSHGIAEMNADLIKRENVGDVSFTDPGTQTAPNDICTVKTA